MSFVTRFDTTVDGWFDHMRGRPVPDAVFEAASQLGDWSLIWHLVNASLGLRSRTEPEQVARVAVAIGGESLLVNQGIKRLFRRGRPVPDATVAARLRKPRTSSFPSGHASAAFTAAGILSDDNPRLRPVLYGLALLVATSRIHTRMHHPSDVVGGAVVGVALASAVKRVWRVQESSRH